MLVSIRVVSSPRLAAKLFGIDSLCALIAMRLPYPVGGAAPIACAQSTDSRRGDHQFRNGRRGKRASASAVWPAGRGPGNDAARRYAVDIGGRLPKAVRMPRGA